MWECFEIKTHINEIIHKDLYFNMKCGINNVGTHTVVLYNDIINITLFTL